eukprot:gene38291-51716_t
MRDILDRPGNDLLSRVLRHSTISADGTDIPHHKTNRTRRQSSQKLQRRVRVLHAPKGNQNTPAGWSSPVARQAHNLKVVSSNLAPATKITSQTPVSESCGRFCVQGSLPQRLWELRVAADMVSNSASLPHTGAATRRALAKREHIMTKPQGSIRVGIGGWVFEPWRGTFYPEGLPQKRELEHAAAHLGTIEINGTYYGSQKPESFARWRAETPDGFVFAVKGSRYITNRRVLAEAAPSIEKFFSGG